MGRICDRCGGVFEVRRRIKVLLVILSVVQIVIMSSCGKSSDQDEWLDQAGLDKEETVEELYQKALQEDVLVVYTVSTRATQTKEAFEAAYPGLYVEIRDLRSPNLVEEVVNNYNNGLSDCDVILCNDNSGEFKEKIVDTGIAVPYLPSDISSHMKEAGNEGMVSFVYEAEMIFYNSARYDDCPVENIWELADPKFENRIYMPNPLHSFSTYAFCGSVFEHEDELAAAYRDLYGHDPETGGLSAAEYFWTEISKNVVFTNSSDEVLEALGSGAADFGIMVSSKLRFMDLGYDMAPVYRLEPFCGCRTSFSAMIARNSRNVNTAKLFIRFLLGESDGSGDGYKPFCTEGTWSVRDDVPDGSTVPLEDIDLIAPDQDYLIENGARLEDFWTKILETKG